ncbi:MAG: SGNH/GDSL hydrolase family protein [Verrucomicrobiota bacterium]
MRFHLTLLLAIVLSVSVPPRETFASDYPVQPGDHIAIVGNTFADQLRVHGYLETLLLSRTQDNPVSIRNLGWAGDRLTFRDRPTNFPTEESTLQEHQTDVIIACFGMGESFDGEEGLADFRKDLRDFITAHRGKIYNGESEVRLVLVSPIAYENLGDITPNWEQRNKELEAYSQAIAETAAEANVAYVHLFDPAKSLMENEEAPDLTTNGIHLNPYGYWALSRATADQLVPGHPAWKLTIDAASKNLTAEGLTITNLKEKDGSLEFFVTEDSWPSLAPPSKQTVPAALSDAQDTLTIENLAPGEYRLEIDDQLITTADHLTWARGVPLQNTPAHAAAEAYRRSVNDKNDQFIYSWKALNQVHIVGERRNSPSGRSLPEEIIEFNMLALERDESLRSGIELKTRIWRLTPISR